MEELVLWGANTLKGVERSSVMTSIIALIVVLMVLSSITTILRVCSRYTFGGKEGMEW